MTDIKGDLIQIVKDLAAGDPSKYTLNCINHFAVNGPNFNNITTTVNGTSPWYLLRAVDHKNHQINFLLLGVKAHYRLWGIEISSGLRMKKACERMGKEKIVSYLKNQVISMLTMPENWSSVELFHHE